MDTIYLPLGVFRPQRLIPDVANGHEVPVDIAAGTLVVVDTVVAADTEEEEEEGGEEGMIAVTIEVDVLHHHHLHHLGEDTEGTRTVIDPRRHDIRLLKGTIHLLQREGRKYIRHVMDMEGMIINPQGGQVQNTMIVLLLRECRLLPRIPLKDGAETNIGDIGELSE